MLFNLDLVGLELSLFAFNAYSQLLNGLSRGSELNVAFALAKVRHQNCISRDLQHY